jgi:hypothetical protein
MKQEAPYLLSFFPELGKEKKGGREERDHQHLNWRLFQLKKKLKKLKQTQLSCFWSLRSTFTSPIQFWINRKGRLKYVY